MTENWYVLRSKPHKEAALYRYATSKGFKAYYPRISVDPVNPRSRKVRPYFPGYMFLNTDLERVGLSTVRYMPLSMGIVSFGGEPAAVPASVIRRLKTELADLHEKGIIRRQFNKGDKLWIREGPFEGCEAIFDIYSSGTDRVKVLLEWLSGRPILVEMAARSIEKRQ